MADIGKLSVQVSASSKSMPADMKKAADDLSAGASALERVAEVKGQSIGRKLAAGISKISSFGEGVYANPAKVINSMFGGVADFIASAPVIGGLIAAPLQAVSAGIGAGIEIYEKNVDRIKALGTGAMKAGLDVGDFQLLARMTGGVEQASHAWMKLQTHLAEAEMAGEGVRTVFDKFGMNGKELAANFATNFDGALGKLADKMAAMPASMRMKALRDLAGRGGAELAPTFMKGSAGVAEERDRMNRMGLGVDGGLVANVKQAEKAKKEISALWEGMGNQITMAVAPALAVISESIGKLPGGFAGLGETIIDTVGAGALFVARIIDGWTNGDMGERLKPYWLEFKAAASEAIDWIGDAFGKMLKSQLGSDTTNLFIDAFGFGTPAQKEAMKEAIRLKKEADNAAAPEGAMRPNADAERWRKEAADLRNKTKEKKPGAAEDWLTDALADIKNRLKGGGKGEEFDPFGKLYDRINKLNDASKGPLGEFKDSMTDLVSLLDKVDKASEALDKTRREKLDKFGGGPLLPFKAIDDGAAELSAYAQYQKLKGAYGDQHKLAGAMEKGSTGAYSAIAAFESNRPENVQEEMKRLMEAAQRQRDEQIRVGREAIKAFGAKPRVAKF